MAIAWPGALPQAPNADGWTRTAQRQTWTFSPDAGPDFVRPAGRKGHVETAGFVMTMDELDIFEAFFNETLSMGSLAFIMADPLTKRSRLVRFAPGQDPYSIGTFGVNHVLVTCNFEVLPS